VRLLPFAPNFLVAFPVLGHEAVLAKFARKLFDAPVYMPSDVASQLSTDHGDFGKLSGLDSLLTIFEPIAGCLGQM
jgi:hypothetical protein